MNKIDFALESDLTDYLRKEQEKIDVTNASLQTEFQKNIMEGE